MSAGLAVDVRALVEHALALGGHLRVGPEKAPFGTEQSNLALVGPAARMVEGQGGRLADAEAIRRRLRGWPGG